MSIVHSISGTPSGATALRSNRGHVGQCDDVGQWEIGWKGCADDEYAEKVECSDGGLW